MVIDHQNVLMVNNGIHVQLLTIKMFQWSITECIQDGY